MADREFTIKKMQLMKGAENAIPYTRQVRDNLVKRQADEAPQTVPVSTM